MSGTINIRPIEAKLTHDSDILSKMDPYCIVHIGNRRAQGQVCKSGGKNPHWNDVITVQRSFEPILYIELKDKDTTTPDDVIGIGMVDLNALTTSGSSSRWYPLLHKKQQVGEIFLEIQFSSSQSYQSQSHTGQHGQIHDPFTSSSYLSHHIVPNTYGQSSYSQKHYQEGSYGQGGATLGQTHPSYGQLGAAYDQPNLNLGQGGSLYDPTKLNLGQGGAVYDQTNPSFGQSGTSYTQTTGVYNQERTQYRQGDLYNQSGVPLEQLGTHHHGTQGVQGGTSTQAGGFSYGQQSGTGFAQKPQSNFDQYGNSGTY